MSSEQAAFHGVKCGPVPASNSASEEPSRLACSSARVSLAPQPSLVLLSIHDGSTELLTSVLTSATPRCRTSSSSVVIRVGTDSILLEFRCSDDCDSFESFLQRHVAAHNKSLFDSKIDEASSMQYFHYYGQLNQQQNMLQDYVRTGTYQRAMLENAEDFHGKVVLDVGAGTGVLSFFALQAGAKKVYAVEASAMAANLKHLAEHNGVGDRIQVINSKVEDTELPEMVDIIISEPMGTMLVNERMLESFLFARKWLKPSGLIFPTTGTLYYSPFTDDALFMEQFNKTLFWCQHSFYGINVSSLHGMSLKETFSQPIIDAVDPLCLRANPLSYVFDFRTMKIEDLYNFTLDYKFGFAQPCTIHGLAVWFDVAFIGTKSEVVLSTAPYTPLTHWYQIRYLMPDPFFCPVGTTISGQIIMEANSRQSYDVTMTMQSGGSRTCKQVYNLKEPHYRFTGITYPSVQPSFDELPLMEEDASAAM